MNMKTENKSVSQIIGMSDSAIEKLEHEIRNTGSANQTKAMLPLIEKLKELNNILFDKELQNKD